MTQEEIIQYLRQGGENFYIKSVDTIRDGGTKVIETDKSGFYVDKNTNQYHNNYPTNSSNLITDGLTIKFLTHTLEKYIKNCEHKLKGDKGLLEKVKTNQHDIYLFRVIGYYGTVLLGRYHEGVFYIQREDGFKYEYQENTVFWKQKLN